MKLKSVPIVGALVVSALVLGTPSLKAQQPPAPDNTKVNKRDQSKASPTADNAKDNAADRDIMQKIRKAIMADKSLSTYAHNVKVIAQNGTVTLKGPVRTAAEKATVEQKAAEVTGADKVINQLTVAPSKKN